MSSHPPLLEELTFGRYKASQVLHHGQTGVVYLASFAGSTKQVAVKALDPKLAGDLVLRERFIRGARALAMVRSPHLASIYEVGVQMPSGQVWCAMELIEGRSLAVVQQGEALSPTAAIQIARQLAAALSATHLGGVIHRNVKPANVMLTVKGANLRYVRLVGFGLVKLLKGDSNGEELTARGATIGTPAYMAPEALVDSSQADQTADVYSLGVVLHELLTGRLPYPDSPRSVVEQLKAKQQRARRLSIESVIDDLVARMLAPDRMERPQTMAEVGELLATSMLAEEDDATRRDVPPSFQNVTPAHSMSLLEISEPTITQIDYDMPKTGVTPGAAPAGPPAEPTFSGDTTLPGRRR